MKSIILDGYVDEPACFGVPPYISPYVRYCAGVLFRHGYDVDYATCDQWRATRGETDERVAQADIVVVIMGLTVPGRYRGGSPLTMRELEVLSDIRRRGTMILGGPIRNGYALRGGQTARCAFPDGIDHIATGDPEAALDCYCRTGEWRAGAMRDYRLLREIAPLGALVVRQHLSYPNVIAEMEISRGCDRTDGHCSFCTEGHGNRYDERDTADVAEEIAALHNAGVKSFRLGRCSNILAYGAERTPAGFRPSAPRLRELYAAIRHAAPNLNVLHTDNCNPATIARFPDESRAALAAIASLNTEGDGLSLGIESLDPAVGAKNSLKVSFDEALLAVRIINEVGNVRRTDRGAPTLPALLPGLNFLFGLAGETRESAEWNKKFLQTLLDENLAVRRINIRRAMLFDGAPLARQLADSPPTTKDRDYQKWKAWVRSEVDPIMLARVAPNGTAIRDVIAEERAGHVIFGRPLGSYPPLIGIVSDALRPGDKACVAVTDRGSRSLTGVVRPLDINDCSRAELTALPGIGRARADFLISRRPHDTSSAESIKKSLEALDAPEIAEDILKYFMNGGSGDKSPDGCGQRPQS